MSDTLVSIEASANIEAAGEGTQPTVSIDAYNGGPIRVKGYKHPVIVDLDGIEGFGESIPFYAKHDDEQIVGYGVATRDGGKVTADGTLLASSEPAQRIVSYAKEGFPWRASIGVQPTNVNFVQQGKQISVNGEQYSGPVFVIRAGQLYEISIVASGADSTATARVAASIKQGKDEMEFKDWLTQNGFVHAELTEGQHKTLRAAYDAEHGDEPADTVESVIKGAKEKERRQQAYGRVVQSAIDQGMDSETAEKLVEAASRDGLSETEFELQVLRLQRAPAISSQRHGHGEVKGEVIEAALARSINESMAEANYKPEVLEASADRFKHGLSLVEFLQLGAKRNGERDVSHRDVRAMLQAAFAPVQAASTYDVGGLLSNLANKMIRNGFDSVESEWRKVASIRSVNDLKEHKSYSLTGDFAYKEVSNGGKLEHATMGEEEYSNRARTYGRLFSITRQDILNDDLGAFDRVRQLIGRGAALKFNLVFWTEFLASLSTFYTTARNNLIESDVTTPLGVNSLTTAFTTFTDQTDPDGNPLGLEPGVLVVPNALKVTGERITRDPEIRVSGGSGETYTTSNPHAGKLELCASTYLNNSNVPNGSAQNWFLAADPLDMPLIEAAFLNGRQRPFIESSDADFDSLGVRMRGYHDFGVAKQEYRAGVMVEDTN